MTDLDPTNGILAAEPMIRLGVFAAVLALLMAWEFLAPRRALTVGRSRRWPGNVGVVVIDALLLRILFPTAAVGLALVVEANGWGLLNLAPVPDWLAILAAIILLDLIIYAQHVLFHAVPPLWRLHRMHHADLDIDVTTGIRFHPVEILLSMGIKLGAVVVLGAPALGVMIFEVLLNATSMFNHSNVRLPVGVDRWLRRILVTPDMHRVHHSIVRQETNSNFGFNLPWWDRMFGTYRAQPAAGHEAMMIGLPVFRDPSELHLDRMLMQPLRSDRTEERMMTDTTAKGNWGQRLSWVALALSVGGLAAALIAAAGSDAGAWSFRIGFSILRYAFYAAMAGGVLAIVAFVISRRSGARTGRLNLVAFVIAAAFGAYLVNQIVTARSVPAIHDATTDLVDVPQFQTLPVRADNLENIPDDGRSELAALDPERRWQAIHREAYGDLRSLRLPLGVAETTTRIEALARARGWDVARVDRQAGIVEATATTLFFRFKDDVVVRVRPDPERPAGSIVDMRSISRVGGSDVGVNAARIKAFLADLQAA